MRDTRWVLGALLGLSLAGAALGAGFGIGRAAADRLTTRWRGRRIPREAELWLAQNTNEKEKP